LLARDGMPAAKADLLQQAAFFERTGNPVKAREKLGSVFDSVGAHQGALGGLFTDTLSKRVSWYRRPTRADWELSLADTYLERGDYLRAATYLYEAGVTAAAQKHQADINDFDARRAAYELERTDDSRQLEYLRNSMAHGLRTRDGKLAPSLASQQALKEKLRQLRNSLHGQ